MPAFLHQCFEQIKNLQILFEAVSAVLLYLFFDLCHHFQVRSLLAVYNRRNNEAYVASDPMKHSLACDDFINDHGETGIEKIIMS